MAKSGNIKIKIKPEMDDFFTDTRMVKCENISCTFNTGESDCFFKSVEITNEGKCEQFEWEK